VRIAVVGLSHHTAPLDVRERLVAGIAEPIPAVKGLVETAGPSEAMLLSTCNRVEAYVVTDGEGAPAGVKGFLVQLAGGRDLDPFLYERAGMEAVRHLFRVASSLDSMVLGEPQILGQVKDAFAAAQEAGTLGPLLGRTVPRSFRVAKRIRTETAIAAGSVSVSSVAVDLAEKIFGSLAGRPVLLVGAGEMGEDAAMRLVKAGGRLLVTNRSAPRAEAVAAAQGGVARPWEALEASLVEADVVLCSTSSADPILDRSLIERVMRERRRRPLFLVDIAVPRDVSADVEKLPDVFLYNVDDLQQVAADAARERAREADVAEAIVLDEVRAYDRELQTLGVAPTIGALRTRLDAIVQGELRRSGGRLASLTSEERAAVDALLEATVAKLLHAPISSLRDAVGTERGDDLVAAVRALFRLDEDA
jgi:glutamyl-tRNA reductase